MFTKILITGCCGFIGFNLSKEFLKNEKIKILGIDNLNNYYSLRLKKERLNNLKNKKNFSFKKIDIINQKKIENIITKFKPQYIYHFAAQAGVQHSIKYPQKYLDNNIVGFFNILEISRKIKPKRIFFASSSSVYGDQKQSLLKEKFKLNPKNLYGLSKKNNEEMAEIYSNLYNMKIIGLRFFSIYGEWGRPDMIIFKIMLAAKNKEKFFINNFGNHYRDFTYIKDTIKILIKLKSAKMINKFEVFNISSNCPIKLDMIIKKILSNISTKPKLVKRNFQVGDIYKTNGDNKKIKKLTKIRFTKFDKALKDTINWNKKYLKLS
tara:strand:+ start:219 stop:1184 length:966 start_codon:yes stop_codon:yes gene_type:complete